MKKGFTLIEILVVLSIIGIILGLSIFGLQGARESSRDAKRKSDLEAIRANIELYKSDCDSYPLILPAPAGTLNGDGSTASCVVGNIYISNMPTDPLPNKSYYYSSDGLTYDLCAALESEGSDACSGSCGAEACDYKVVNP